MAVGYLGHCHTYRDPDFFSAIEVTGHTMAIIKCLVYMYTVYAHKTHTKLPVAQSEVALKIQDTTKMRTHSRGTCLADLDLVADLPFIIIVALSKYNQLA
jgi:hypothetical protein